MLKKAIGWGGLIFLLVSCSVPSEADEPLQDHPFTIMDVGVGKFHDVSAYAIVKNRENKISTIYISDMTLETKEEDYIEFGLRGSIIHLPFDPTVRGGNPHGMLSSVGIINKDATPIDWNKKIKED